MIRLFKNMTKEHLFYTFWLIFFITAQVVLELTVPDYMSNITKLINTPGSSSVSLTLRSCPENPA